MHVKQLFYMIFPIKKLDFVLFWKIQSELTPRANVSLTPENFFILTP